MNTPIQPVEGRYIVVARDTDRSLVTEWTYGQLRARLVASRGSWETYLVYETDERAGVVLLGKYDTRTQRTVTWLAGGVGGQQFRANELGYALAACLQIAREQEADQD